MVSSLVAAETALRGGAAGILLATGVAFLGGASGRPIRLSGALFSFSVAGYALVSLHSVHDLFGALFTVPLVAALGGVGYCWQFVRVLFEDRGVSARSLMPALTLTLIGLAGVLVGPAFSRPIALLHNLAEIALLFHALAVIGRGAQGDLVESRRRIRGPFLAAVVGYAIVVSGVEIRQSMGGDAAWHGLAGAAGLFVLSLLGAGLFLDARLSVLGAPAPRPPVEPARPELDGSDQHILYLLDEAMKKREVWRQEGLSIGVLAREVGVPEHVLRRLINARLGHRNFSAYLNTHRIAAARELLSDPSRARTTVAAIAFEIGFASIGPFNRAFREETGRSPTQWRAEALAKGPPNPTISG